MTRVNIAAPLAILLLSVTASSAARADGSANAVAAEALFDQAKQLMAQGQYAEACPKLAESQRLDAGVGTLLNLADCYEQNGQTASAWVTFREVSAAARMAGQAEREQIGRDRAGALEPKLSRITIDVTSPVAGLEVRRDGALLEKPLWGLAVPVDPGAHELDAVAPGKKAWHATLTVKDPGQSIIAKVPALEDASKKDALPPPTTPITPATPILPATRTTPTMRYTGIAVAGVGVAGVIVGAVFGGRAMSKNKASTADCHDGNHCNQAGVDLREQALSAARVSTVAFIAGGVLVGGGAALYLVGSRRAQAASVGVAVGLGSLALEGAF